MWINYWARNLGVPALAAALMTGFCPAASAGSGGKAATAAPIPDQEKKVYTNDDIAAWHDGARQQAEVSTFSNPAQQSLTASAVVTVIPRNPEEDPLWYARQTVALEDQASALDARIAELQDFRTTGAGVTTGLNIYAPCQGVGTDNLIAELIEQRQVITAQISALQDTARQNDVPPETFVNASAIVAAAAGRVRLTPAGERARLRARLDRLTDDLAQVNGVVSGMEHDMAAQQMTLLKYNGDGGNMTTNLLQDLDGQAKGLRTQISDVSDAAYRAGIPASQLP